MGNRSFHSSISNISESSEVLYYKNKEAPKGTILTCPVCGDTFTKIKLNQIFPSSHRLCRFNYWRKNDIENRKIKSEYFNI